MNWEKTSSYSAILKNWDTIEITWVLDKIIVKIEKEAKKLLVFNKPVWFIVSKSNKQGKNIYDILPEKYSNRYYIWRLDKDSCGLLLLTNDSALVNIYSHPSNKIEKEYEVLVDRKLSNFELNGCIEWILDLDEKLSFKRVEFEGVSNSEWNAFLYNICLEEGKNRHIRRVFESFWVKIFSLKRLREGEILLWNLDFWEYKEIGIL